MTNEDAIKWLENLKQDIGQLRHEDLWHYEQAIYEIIELLKEQEAVEPIAKEDDTYECICGAIVGWDELDASGIVQTRFNYCPFAGRR